MALTGPDGPVGGRASQPRRLALIAIIGAARDHGLSRDKAIALLWPDTDPVEARHHLSQSVYLLRKALGDSAITTHGESLALNSSVVTSDVAVFREALRAGHPGEAADLYQGPFLDGFYVRDAPDFEEWVEAERRELADAFATAVESAARSESESGRHVEAADLWRRLVSHDPYNSRAVLGLMDSLVEGGDPGNALVVAEEHSDRMLRDLGVGPAAEVEESAERIRASLPATRRRVRATEFAAGHEVDSAAAHLHSAVPRRHFPRWALMAAVGIVAGAVLWTGARLLEPRPARPFSSVGVIPFVNLTGDPDMEHLADGVTDELISVLSRVPALEVPAQISSFHFKGRSIEARAVGDSLGVRVLLEGSLRSVGDGLRVTAQLIDADTGFHLWTETYDRPLGDLPGVPAEIARAAVPALGIDQEGDDRGFEPRTAVLSAWEDYEKGRRYWRLRTREAHDSAFAAFRRAIGADSTFALAWSGLVDTYLTGIYWSDVPNADSIRAEVRGMAARAMELDSTLAEVQNSYAAVLVEFDRDPEAAEAHYRRAIELDPAYVDAYYWYYEALNGMGRYDEAARIIRRAYEVDPLSPVGVHHLGINLMWGQARPAEAIPYFEYVLDLEPEHRGGQINRAVCLAFVGRFEEARDAALQMLESNPNDPEMGAQAARVLMLVRDYDRVGAIVDSIDAGQTRYAYYYSAQALANQGRFDEALDQYRAAAKRFAEDTELKLLIAYTYAQAGDSARARAIADQVVGEVDVAWHERGDAGSRWRYRDAAPVYGAMGDHDEAFRLLRKAMRIRRGVLANLAVAPWYDFLRQDPRFDELLKELHLPKLDLPPPTASP